ncbi:hypothetical protein QL285_001994 [Trifolium repens]|nr:hypothetical protein QL285_001994 [Trifolium repens]
MFLNHVASQDSEATRFVASLPPPVSLSFPNLLVHDGGSLPSAEACCFYLSYCYCKGSVELEVWFSEVWFRRSGAPVVVMIGFVVVCRSMGRGVFLRR